MSEERRAPTMADEKLDNLLRMTERMLIKLFGEVDAEAPTGRLPMIEAKQKDHEERIKSLERLALKIGGAIALVSVIGGLIEAASHFASAIRH